MTASSLPSSSCMNKHVRGYVYVGPVYAIEELDEAFCPWCIADGTAAAKFDAEFTDVGAGVPDDVPPDVLEHRAPHAGLLRAGRAAPRCSRQGRLADRLSLPLPPLRAAPRLLRLRLGAVRRQQPPQALLERAGWLLRFA